MDKKKAIILGGTSAHIDLINKLKYRGYHTILIDYFANPIAKPAADEHIQESTLDKEKVFEIAMSKNVELVISTSVDQANVTAVYVLEKMGLYTPYSYETALNVSNKVLMKKIMYKNNIPTSRYIIVNGLDDCINHKLEYPVIVKPSDSNGSKGVKKAKNINELKKYLDFALSISRDKKAIIEEYKTGKEIGLDCLVSGGDVNIVLSRERIKIERKQISTQQIYGSIWPCLISEEKVFQLKKIVKQIAEAFNLDNTAIILQAIVAEDEINVIEFAPRIGGGENSRIIQLSTGFDMVNAEIDSYLGEKININVNKPELYFADNLIYANPGNFGYIDGYKELVDNKTIEYLVELKTPGMEIGSEFSSNNRVGAYVVKSKDVNGLYVKIKKANSCLEVYDINGEQIMRKDIYMGI